MDIKKFLNTLKFKRNTRELSLTFDEFMRRETYLFSPEYARRMVNIHGGEHLIDSKGSGGILLFLHHGSFFLSGGAIMHKLGLNFSLIASRRNLKFMPSGQQEFWKNVHSRSARLYENRLMYSDYGVRNILNFLNDNIFLGVAVDVQEKGHYHQTRCFQFQDKHLFFQTSAERLAILSKKKVFGMVIVYDSKKKMHDLHISPPLLPDKSFSASQSALEFMESIIPVDHAQMFHNLNKLFSKSSSGSN
jgi:lauroyl/myristoyl acyltransferase